MTEERVCPVCERLFPEETIADLNDPVSKREYRRVIAALVLAAGGEITVADVAEIHADDTVLTVQRSADFIGRTFRADRRRNGGSS